MRPRVFPAEDGVSDSPRIRRMRGFNEAAGIPRGRPEHNARRPPDTDSFNEAAGIPRGRHDRLIETACNVLELQ